MAGWGSSWSGWDGWLGETPPPNPWDGSWAQSWAQSWANSDEAPTTTVARFLPLAWAIGGERTDAGGGGPDESDEEHPRTRAWLRDQERRARERLAQPALEAGGFHKPAPVGSTPTAATNDPRETADEFDEEMLAALLLLID